MIVGIGVDIVAVDRIRKALEREGFIRRFFSESEMALFKNKANPVQTIAAHFAMKEAVAKALGTGVRGFDLKEVSIERDALGRPVLVPLGRLATVLETLGIAKVHLSCSHEAAYAVGHAIAED